MNDLDLEVKLSNEIVDEIIEEEKRGIRPCMHYLLVASSASPGLKKKYCKHDANHIGKNHQWIDDNHNIHEFPLDMTNKE